MNNSLINIIKQSIDMHFHIGPEIIPRKYTVQTLINEEKGKLAGLVLKNHFYSTTSFIAEIKDARGLNLFGSIALNNSVGGLNPDAIYAASLLTKKPFIVWFPTINANNFLRNSKYEIAPEWVKNNNFKGRLSSNVKAVQMNKKKVQAVLGAIKKSNAILATGHISWKESVELINLAIKSGLSKIVITHPIYQRINMSLPTQKEMTEKGCFIEQCYSMYSIDNIPIKKIARQIKTIGANKTILSSDVGQAYSQSPSKSLYKFASLLLKEGVSEKELATMLVENPRQLLAS